MTRPKRHPTYHTSADIDAEIRRLEAERQRLIDAEDQRRGALIREYLSGANGDALRTALGACVSPRDIVLFALDGAPLDGPGAADRRPRSRAARAAPREATAIPVSV